MTKTCCGPTIVTRKPPSPSANHRPERTHRAVQADARSGALAVAIRIGRIGEIDHAVGGAPGKPRQKQQRESGHEPVGECRERARGAGRRRQRIGAEAARERRNPTIADDADDAVDREQDRDRCDLDAERRRIERQHHIDERVAEPHQAETRRCDHGVAITLPHRRPAPVTSVGGPGPFRAARRA